MGLDVARLAISCFPLLFRASPLCDRVELGPDGTGSEGFDLARFCRRVVMEGDAPPKRGAVSPVNEALPPESGGS
eukprot:3486657-Prymnesium_polylepis.1